MYAKLKMIGAFILGIGVFILSIFSYRAGKKSGQLDQAEADNLAQREITKEVTEGNEKFQEKVDEARSTNTGSGRFTE